MSYQINVDPQSMAGSRLIAMAIDEIQNTYGEEKRRNRLTQQSLATRLRKGRSMINRWLLGRENLTLRTLGELAWAMNREAVIRFVDPTEAQPDRTNERVITPYGSGAISMQISPRTASSHPFAFNPSGAKP